MKENDLPYPRIRFAKGGGSSFMGLIQSPSLYLNVDESVATLMAH